MPFITEEIWQHMEERKAGESICRAEFPKGGSINQDLLNQFDQLFEIITKVREIRNSKQLSPKLALPLCIKTSHSDVYDSVQPIMSKLANLESVSFTNEAIADAQTFVIKADQFFVPLSLDENPEEVKAEAEKELAYLEGFKKSVEAKLANERFVQNAKADLVERERQKLQDAENKIQSLKEVLAKLS
jgi:valyl-tRNA synthetase